MKTRPHGALLLAAALLLAEAALAIEPARDLAADGAEAARRGVPVLLAVTRADCDYCATLKREILEPMRLSGDAPDRVLIREVDVDSRREVTGFDGARASGWSVADGYEAMFTPTVLIVGPAGEELVERIIGLNTPEMYGWYLDRAIDEATAVMTRAAATQQPVEENP